MSEKPPRSGSRFRTIYEITALAIISAVAGQVFTLFTDAECPSWIYECAVEWRLLHIAGAAFFFSSFVAVLMLPLALREFSRMSRQDADSVGGAKPAGLRFWIYCNMAAVLLMHFALYTFGLKFGSG
jgi:hypothetical protein